MKIKFTRIKNDINGNPRYVCHPAEFLSAEEIQTYDVDDLFIIAIRRSGMIGGKKYRGKKLGSRIVFQSYNLSDLERQIKTLRVKLALNHL